MLALLVANLKIMVRDRQAIFWALAFPLILVVVFGVFDIDGGRTASIAIVDHANAERSREFRSKLAAVDYLLIDPRDYSEAEAVEALQDGELEYVLVIPRGMARLSSSSSLLDQEEDA